MCRSYFMALTKFTAACFVIINSLQKISNIVFIKSLYFHIVVCIIAFIRIFKLY